MNGVCVLLLLAHALLASVVGVSQEPLRQAVATTDASQVVEQMRIEFYIGSKLMLISLVRRGGDICVDCCDFPYPEYYGFGKREKPKRKRR